MCNMPAFSTNEYNNIYGEDAKSYMWDEGDEPICVITTCRIVFLFLFCHIIIIMHHINMLISLPIYLLIFNMRYFKLFYGITMSAQCTL